QRQRVAVELVGGRFDPDMHVTLNTVDIAGLLHVNEGGDLGVAILGAGTGFRDHQFASFAAVSRRGHARSRPKARSETGRRPPFSPKSDYFAARALNDARGKGFPFRMTVSISSYAFTESRGFALSRTRFATLPGATDP